MDKPMNVPMAKLAAPNPSRTTRLRYTLKGIKGSSARIRRHLKAEWELTDTELGGLDFLTREISNAKAQAIANTHMDSRQDHLNALLDDDDFGRRRILREGSIPRVSTCNFREGRGSEPVRHFVRGV
jgi:hypothetical protein